MTPGSSRAARKHERGVGPGTYLFFFVSFGIVLLLTHSPYLTLPYFWDELGQFVPAALDILHDSAWVPHSTVPNAHPPGVMAYLAAVWKIFGYSIAATRVSMLLIASIGVLSTFLLAIQLCRGLTGAPAFLPVLLLLLDPLFYTQSMMAQLDMPAMVFTVLGLLLFLQDHHKSAAMVCIVLVLSKETGALLPLIFAIVLLADPARTKYAAYYLAPFIVLAVWFFVLWRATGQILGDAGYAHYNVAYALHPVRATLSLARRFFYLFIDDFRFVGAIAIFLAWKRSKIYSNRAWSIVWAFLGAHILMVSLLGGAELERYVLPVLPLLYIAMAAAWSQMSRLWRTSSFALVAAGLLAGLFFNPPFPFPFENNLAMADFVGLHRKAADFVERVYPNQTIYTAWPLTGALRDPAFGYVNRKLATFETSDFRVSTLEKIDPKGVNVMILYSRTWEPEWGVLRWPLVQRFLRHFYEYEPQMKAGEINKRFGLSLVNHWDQRGQWVDVYAKTQ